MKKRTPIYAAALSAAALCAYRAFRGYGIFNKFRFAELHSAVSRYLETHYPGATYSSIEDTGSGYSTIINCGTKKIHLHITKAANGVLIFSESSVDI